jgi:hypothetical protein
VIRLRSAEQIRIMLRRLSLSFCQSRTLSQLLPIFLSDSIPKVLAFAALHIIASQQNEILETTRFELKF